MSREHLANLEESYFHPNLTAQIKKLDSYFREQPDTLAQEFLTNFRTISLVGVREV